MSGICGTFGDLGEEIEGEILSSMLNSIRHRGPDGEHAYLNPEQGIAIGQVHLNSFSPDSQAPAPGFAKTEAVVVAMDGCVTN